LDSILAVLVAVVGVFGGAGRNRVAGKDRQSEISGKESLAPGFGNRAYQK
jgi:hypothetical protein